MEIKKEYQAPKVEVVNLEYEDAVMACSIGYDDKLTTDGIARGRKRLFWDE